MSRQRFPEQTQASDQLRKLLAQEFLATQRFVVADAKVVLAEAGVLEGQAS